MVLELEDYEGACLLDGGVKNHTGSFYKFDDFMLMTDVQLSGWDQAYEKRLIRTQ
jgi:hypothetical protein